MIQLRIEGEPVPKGRPRFSVIRGKVHAYTPAKTMAAEEEIAWHLRSAMAGRQPTKERCFVTLTFFTKSKAKDLDNLTKLVLDAANGIVFEDDRQVDAIHAEIWRGKNVKPSTEIDIAEMGMALEEAA